MANKLSILSLFFWGTLCFSQNYNDSVNKLIQGIKAPTISVSTLHQKKNNPNIIILDAREREEYKVSHIKNARFVGYKKFNLEKYRNEYQNKEVIVYCSVGYRSGRVVEKLRKLGIDAYNLFGGVIEWKNSGFKLYNYKNQETEKVHTYNKEWGKWLLNGEATF